MIFFRNLTIVLALLAVVYFIEGYVGRALGFSIAAIWSACVFLLLLPPRRKVNIAIVGKSFQPGQVRGLIDEIDRSSIDPSNRHQ